MDQRKAVFSHERRLGGLSAELRIEPRDGTSAALILKSFSLGRLLFDEEDFLLWVANSANDFAWVSWVFERWQAVDEEGSATPT